MARNKQKMLERMQQTVRKPDPARLIEEPAKQKRKGRQTLPMSISFFPEDLQWVDRIAQDLKGMGISDANRSLVVQQALFRLKRDLAQKERNQIIQDFLEYLAQRPR